MAMLIEILCLLLHLFSLFFLSDRNETPKVDSIRPIAILKTSTTFEIGQLSRFLLNEGKDAAIVDCFHKESKFEAAGSIQSDENDCLADIKNSKVTNSVKNEEELILDFYSCLFRAELSYLRNARTLQAPSKISLAGVENSIPFTSRAACLVIGLAFLTWTLSSVRRFEQLDTRNVLSRLRILANLSLSRIHPIYNQIGELETKVLSRLRKLGILRQTGLSVDDQGKSPIFNELRRDGNIPKASNETHVQGEGLDAISKNEEITGVVETYVGLKDLPINLMSKNKALVFDLTTKEGRKEWKTYISRDKYRQLSCREQIYAHYNSPAEFSTRVTEAQVAPSFEMDPSLENVPLYDKHGKPLRRVCVPGIGWISRRKYLEQRG
ncbi:uncharacterized protein LALA0_S01e11562g [Lachancea lanzarotensis]|uniref:LALA0S01e11562g1_1 n=1 Tax=Lachancea lanzarotensis TaxID=1245769 RepID=A0A0C7N1P7_9SACH|nr:uncharacterized protein LALA0_S01e11562g [Lachancea lanzarotensis]CEP60468.1 LALA0S01e11562g1_1 [Lachancea lanzarotensis]